MITTRRFAAILAADVSGSGCRKVLLLALLLVPLPTTAAAQAERATTIDLVWTEIFDRIKPDPRVGIQTRKTMTITLHGKTRLLKPWKPLWPIQPQFEQHGAIGQWLAGRFGERLVRTEEYPHHARVMTVTVDGRLCSLSVVHQLKSGHSTYLHPMLSRRGQTRTYSKIATQSASCSIR